MLDKLPNPARVPAFVGVTVQLSWEDMKNIHNRKEDVCRGLQEGQLRMFVVLPLERRIDQHAVASLKLGRRILEKLQEVDDSIEIIAREIARQAKERK